MNITWVSSNVGCCIPENACVAGFESDGSAVFVGRAMHNGNHTPAKVLHNQGIAYVPYGGDEVAKKNYEVLCGTGLSWAENCNGNVSVNAVECGKDGSETHYIGRANHNGILIPGKILKSHGCMFISYGGSEIRYINYEVLVKSKRSEWVSAMGKQCVPAGAILAGHDSDGSKIYIGRAFYSNDQLPSKVSPSKQVAFVSYDGGEHLVYEYEFLCNRNTRWEHFCGCVPGNAVIGGGKTSYGETLYIGRGCYCGNMIVGKIHLSHNCLYISYCGSEISLKNYEILVEN